ncbi:MAG: diacylglycerol kinase family lipid kinase [Paraprevotella sp.]|nr:diacylglycerol kinase family lipid kinase [Paraprevotella sp.]
MAKRHIVFIVNPISGTQNKESILNLISRHLDPEKFSYQIMRTEYAGHAALLSGECAARGCDAVVAVGGDGTVNEVARSLVESPVALGIIPCGSGNGLARHLHIPMDPLGAIKVLVQFELECIDYGKINEVPFFCTCGVGFDAFVSSKFAHSGKRGMLTYLENTLREGLKYKPDTYEIEIEGETVKYKAFLIACANASQYGNNAYIAPFASISDGLMDVTIMEPFTVLEVPQIAIQLFNRTLLQNSRIKTFRCKHLHIHREHPGVVHYDGDPMTVGTDIDVQLFEKGLNVIINARPGSEKVLGRVVSELYDELTSLSVGLRNRNLRRINHFNKEMRRRLRR